MSTSTTRSLDGASVIVAGATGGLGSEIAGLLDARGAHLTLLGRDPTRFPSLPDAATVRGDLGAPETSTRAVETALERFGRIDGVINAAGVVAFGPLVELGDDALDELFRANVIGPLRLIRAVLPHLDGGFVVNLSAVVAEQPTANLLVYSATKAALTAASTALRRELRRQRIDVLDVRPPHIETGLATRPLAGRAPELPTGLAPRDVAERIVAAIERCERELPTAAFRSLPTGTQAA